MGCGTFCYPSMQLYLAFLTLALTSAACKVIRRCMTDSLNCVREPINVMHLRASSPDSCKRLEVDCTAAINSLDFSLRTKKDHARTSRGMSRQTGSFGVSSGILLQNLIPKAIMQSEILLGALTGLSFSLPTDGLSIIILCWDRLESAIASSRSLRGWLRRNTFCRKWTCRTSDSDLSLRTLFTFPCLCGQVACRNSSPSSHSAL